MSIYEGFDPSQVPEPFGNRHDPKHTSSDLVEWCSQDLPCARYQALEAENERLRGALQEIIAYSQKHIDDTDAYTMSRHKIQAARAALGEKQ